MTIEEIIDKHWDEMFNEVLETEGDNLHELLIEVKTGADGKTVRRSWLDRNKMLRDE